MEQKILRKAQLTLLEIAKEVRRVCDENNIDYFLDSGTLIGAIRHKGFIPWDDDLDIGMLREDYEKFIAIASDALDNKYYLQTWTNDPEYPLPFAKVRKKGTVYKEEKSSESRNNGFYVDIFPFDFQPDNSYEQKILSKKIVQLERTLLMKCHSKPWIENGKIVWKKRVGYIYFQVRAALTTKEKIIDTYTYLLQKVGKTNTLMIQTGHYTKCAFKYEWLAKTIDFYFENEKFSIPIGYDQRLHVEYGDYMKLPPIEQRKNRHGIIKIDFGQ